MKKLLFTSMVFLLSVGLFLKAVEAADWVQDWIRQKTETSPSYFEGQKRGYLNGGSFSARWYNSNDYIASVSPPRIKSGCGGIDVFGGAVSFMEFDQLVKKLQGMITSAPAVAFDLAFNVLCEPCAKSIKSFEAITDQLNALQFSDCQASKVLVARGFQGMGSDNAQIKAMAESEFAIETGLKAFREDVRKGQQNETPIVKDEKSMLSACPVELKAIFATPGKTVFEAIGELKGYPQEYIDLARGFVGDVLIRETTDGGGNKQLLAIPMKPCDENKPDSIDNLVSGKVYARPKDGSKCKLQEANLSKWVTKNLTEITKTMKTKNRDLSDSERSFIDTIPIPIYGVLKVAAEANQTESVMATVADMTTRAYAQAIMSDLYDLVTKSLYTAEEIKIAKGSAGQNCKTDLLMPAIEGLKEIQPRVREATRNIQASYAGMIAETNMIQEFLGKFERFSEIAKASLSGRFHPAIVNRAISGQ